MKKIFDDGPCLSLEELKDYLNGQLNKEKSHRVENHLLDCMLCAAALKGIQIGKEEGLEIIPGDLQAPAIAKRKRLTLTFRQIRRVAVVIFVLVLLSLGIYWQKTKEDRLVARLFEPYESSYILLRGEENGSTMDVNLLTALAYYDEGEYGKSVSHFEAYLSVNASDDEARLLVGVAYFMDGQLGKAQTRFEKIRKDDPEKFGSASWYLALCLLKAKKTAEAEKVLEELMGSDDAYYKEKASNSEWHSEKK